MNECGIFARGTIERSDGSALSATLAKILCADSPLHAWANSRMNPDYVREDKEIFDLGTVAHALILEGLDIAVVIDLPDWKTKVARETRDGLRAIGQVPILKKHWDRVQLMVAAGNTQLAAHKQASEVFTEVGKPELTLAWVDDHGVPCRARLDWLRNDLKRIADYKGTGTSANPEGIARLAVSQGWDIQSAFYLRGLRKITGKDADFVFVVQEDSMPFALSVVGMGPDFLWAGEKKVQHAIDTWAECLATGHWAGYTNQIVYPVLPAWEENRIQEEELRNAEARH